MKLDILTAAKRAELMPIVLGQDPASGTIHLLAGTDVHHTADFVLEHGALTQGTIFTRLADGLEYFKRFDLEVRDVVFE